MSPEPRDLALLALASYQGRKQEDADLSTIEEAEDTKEEMEEQS